MRAPQYQMFGSLSIPITCYEAFARAEVNREREFKLRRFLMGLCCSDQT